MVVMTQDERPDILKPLRKNQQASAQSLLGLTSALKVFEECPYRTYISGSNGYQNLPAQLLTVDHKSMMKLSNMWMVVSKSSLTRL